MHLLRFLVRRGSIYECVACSKDGQQRGQMRIGRLDLPSVEWKHMRYMLDRIIRAAVSWSSSGGRLERRWVARNASHVGL